MSTEPDEDCWALVTYYIGTPKSEDGETPDEDITSLAQHIEAAINAWCQANEYIDTPSPTTKLRI